MQLTVYFMLFDITYSTLIDLVEVRYKLIISSRPRNTAIKDVQIVYGLHWGFSDSDKKR